MKVKVLSAMFLAAALIALRLPLYAAAVASGYSGAAADDASLYADATRAINESRWADAAGRLP